MNTLLKKKSLRIIGIILAVLISLHVYNNYLYSFHGLVIDADTKQPIENAVVVAVWHKEKSVPGLGTERRFVDEKEVLTNNKGQWSIRGPKGDDIGSSIVSALLSLSTCFILGPFTKSPPDIVIYKPGYCAWPDGQNIESCKSNLKAKGEITELPKLTKNDRETHARNIPRLPHFFMEPSRDYTATLPLYKRFTDIEGKDNWYLIALPVAIDGERDSFSERSCSSSYCLARKFSYSAETSSAPPSLIPLNMVSGQGYFKGGGVVAPLKSLPSQPQTMQRSVIDITTVIPLLPQTPVDTIVHNIANNMSDQVIQSARKYLTRNQAGDVSFQMAGSGQSAIDGSPAAWRKFSLATSTEQILMNGMAYTVVKNNIGYIIIAYSDSSARQAILDKAVEGMVLKEQVTEIKPMVNKPQRCY